MMINCRNVRNRTTVQASHYEGPGRGTSRELITGHLRGRRIPSRNMAAAVAFYGGVPLPCQYVSGRSRLPAADGLPTGGPMSR
jgi:hypothetical protein